MAGFIWGDGGAQLTPEAIAAQRKIAQAMMARGGDYSPVQSWTQGAARVAEGMLGGFDAARADMAERQNATAEKELLASLITGGSAGAPTTIVPPAAAVAPTAVPAAAPAASGDAASAIASIESGGKYDLLGPVTKTGDRAYGKYQVMGANIPQWTKAHLGQAMTPEQFLASPEAQDAVFKGQFGQYAQKYGPEGAAKAWFAGERGMNNPNAKDQLGTSVQSYADRFTKAYGGLPYQVAGPAVAAPAGVPASEPQVAAAPAAAPPAAVQTVAQAAPSGLNPKLLTAMASPYVSDSTKKILGIMLQQQMADKVSYQTTPDGDILALDPHGRASPKVVYQASPKPIAVPENSKLWDPRSRTFIGGGQPDTITGPDGKQIVVQPGQDAKVIREAVSKAAAGNALPASFDDATKLRHEVTQLPSYKNIAQAAPIYKSMVETAGTNSKASDLNLVYGLGKIMDPNSVVREGEMVMVKNTASLPDWLVGAANSLNGGAALTPETRAAILREAHNRITSYKTMYDQDAGFYRGVASRNRANPDDVIPDFGEFKPYTPAVAAPTPAAIDDLVKKYSK